ncbi:hypothetical protein [Nocardiopsis sp. FIRDI 009]|uniref:hypothetical protein n=1 Tax=Nocardiopsis sp. FIRDI 009 TaxID=714197 RepID=UPI000E22E0AD|nr:hypothetical protein [Nocardiopsis sp. FIRDI 009]
MIAKPQTVQATRPLSTPELAVIASVIIGQMDERWSAHTGVTVYLSYIGGDTASPLIDLIIRDTGTAPAERAAWLADLSRVLGEPVEAPSPRTGIATLYHRDWQGTGITVAGQATVLAQRGEAGR